MNSIKIMPAFGTALAGARGPLVVLAPATLKLLLLAGLAMGVSACRGEEPGTHVAGWAMLDASQRHPIVVSQQPANMSLRVARGSTHLTPAQRAQVIDFMSRYRGRDTGNGRISISVASGAANEVAVLHAVAELRELLRDFAVDDTRVAVQAYHGDREPQPPIRISYARFVAEGPNCGNWAHNVGDAPRNLPYTDLGCSNQKMIAAQVANPADLLGPRSMTPNSGERRDQVWEKYIKGESTIAKKDNEEKAQVKGAQ